MSDLAMLITLEMSLLCKNVLALHFLFNVRTNAARVFSKVQCLNRLHCFLCGELCTFHRVYEFNQAFILVFNFE